jgi:hypothetical protein
MDGALAIKAAFLYQANAEAASDWAVFRPMLRQQELSLPSDGCLTSSHALPKRSQPQTTEMPLGYWTASNLQAGTDKAGTLRFITHVRTMLLLLNSSFGLPKRKKR